MKQGRFTSFLALALLIWLAATGVKAQIIDDEPEVVSLYAKAKRQLRELDYSSAFSNFSRLVDLHPQSPNADLFLFHKAKAAYYLGEYTQAIDQFRQYTNRYPASEIVPHAQFFAGNAAVRAGNLDDALRLYLAAYRRSDDERLNRLLLSSLTAVVQQSPDLSRARLDLSTLPDTKRCLLAGPVADVLLQRGEREWAQDLLAACGDSLDDPTAVAALSQVDDRELVVALVLPQSGELGSFGQQIYNGATIAAEHHRQSSGRIIRLVPYDSKGDPIDAGRMIRDLSRSQSVDVVVGPLTSEEAAVSSAALDCGNLPLIAPAATEAGLTRLSETSFQLAPSVELEGAAIAQYAVVHAGCDTAIVLSSTLAEHMRMSRAFIRQFESLGGTVISRQYYPTRDTDFGPYLLDIKRDLVGQPGDSVYFVNTEGDTIEFDVLPVRVDCIFMPGSPRQLRQLVPQVHFYNIAGLYLGADGWGDEMVYTLGDDITKRAVFASPFISGRQSAQFSTLARDYDTRFGEPPKRLAALGFDAVALVAQAASDGSASRSSITEFLKTVRNYEGASGRITFGDYRENTEMPLYRIENKRPVPLASTGTSAPGENAGSPQIESR